MPQNGNKGTGARGLKARRVFEAGPLDEAVDRRDPKFAADLKVIWFRSPLIAYLVSDAAQRSHVDAVKTAQNIDIVIPSPGVEDKAGHDKRVEEVKLSGDKNHRGPEDADSERRIGI